METKQLIDHSVKIDKCARNISEKKDIFMFTNYYPFISYCSARLKKFKSRGR